MDNEMSCPEILQLVFTGDIEPWNTLIFGLCQKQEKFPLLKGEVREEMKFNS